MCWNPVCSTVPRAVSGLSAEDVNTTAIRLRWVGPDDFKPGPDASYQVSLVGGNTVPVKTETHVFSGLTAGQLYNFKVWTVVAGVESTRESISRQISA